MGARQPPAFNGLLQFSGPRTRLVARIGWSIRAPDSYMACGERRVWAPVCARVAGAPHGRGGQRLSLFPLHSSAAPSAQIEARHTAAPHLESCARRLAGTDPWLAGLIDRDRLVTYRHTRRAVKMDLEALSSVAPIAGACTFTF